VPLVNGYEVRPATVDDAAAYVRCHMACLSQTYATIMPPAFFAEHRRDIPRQIVQTREDWARADGVQVDGVRSSEAEARTRSWVALDGGGNTVGVARSGPGPQDWEVTLGAPTPSVQFELHHIYTLQQTHGSGLGQRLLDQAVGQRDAYLWILDGNERARRFYVRNGFTPDGVEMRCGPSWFHRRQYRMLRRAPIAGDSGPSATE
jgi:ribosomal protein S18 acetylase RimI-like enzyme